MTIVCLNCNRRLLPSQSKYCSHSCCAEFRIIKKFWSKVSIVKDKKSCWVWAQSLKAHKFGYGVVEFKGKKKVAHRFAYELVNKLSLLSSQKVCHKCDNPPCCRPSHLFIGSQKDNVDDMISKLRHRGGIDDSKLILTHKQVSDIISLNDGGIPQKEIAKVFGISPSYVSRLINGNRRRYRP